MDSKAQKTHLRKTHLAARKALPPEEKQRLDRAVFTRFTALSQYKAAKTLLCYVSSDIEVDTRAILQHALQAGKTVAVPRCIPGTTEMEFHMITSLSMLSPGRTRRCAQHFPTRFASSRRYALINTAIASATAKAITTAFWPAFRVKRLGLSTRKTLWRLSRVMRLTAA